MAIQFLHNLDLNGNQLLEAKLETSASDVSQNLGTGTIYFNTTSNAEYIKIYDGNSWIKAPRQVTAGGNTLLPEENLTISGTSNAIDISESAGTVTIDLSDTINGDRTFGNDVTITGDLTVNGTTTTISTTNTTISDSLIELGTGTTGTPANDAGIVIERGDSNNAFIGFDESADKFIVGTGTFTGSSTGDLTITTGTLVANIEGDVTGNVTGSLTGNADTATALANARDFSLTGDVTATAVSFDGTGNVTLSTTIAANSVALGTDTTGNYVATVAAGGGIDVSGSGSETAAVTVSHEDTSSQASVNNSDQTVIQDVTLDTYGHVTGLTSVDLSSAFDNAGKVTKKIVGDASTTAFTVTHNLDTPIVSVTLLDYGNDGTGATYEQVYADVQRSSDDAVTVTFANAPSATQDYLALITQFPAIS